MGRTAAGPGIAHYPTDSDHTSNKKIRLLFIEFEQAEQKGGHAYWVWKCLLDWTYRHKGYFFDTTQKEELLLFSSEHCKMPLDFIQRVILSCLEKNLFNKDLYNRFAILTSERIQFNFLYATYERRRKGRRIYLKTDYFLISAENEDISTEKYHLNVFMDELKPLKTWIMEYFPRKIPQSPRSSTHSIVYKTITNSKSSLNSIPGDTSPGSENDEDNDEPETENPEIEKPEKKNAGAPATKKRTRPKPQDVTPHWAALKEQFDFFVRQNYNAPFSWNATEYTNLSKILKELQKRAEENKKVWDLGTAHLRWQGFMSAAFGDKYLHDNFSPSHLYSQRNKIFLNGTNKQSPDSIPAKPNGQHSADGKQSSKSNERLQELTSLPNRVQELADSLRANKNPE